MKKLIIALVIVLFFSMLVYMAYVLMPGLFPGLVEKIPFTSPPAIPAQAQVRITNKGFVPQVVMIKKGMAVFWVNTDQKPHQIASDPHPAHSLLPSLGRGKPLSPNSSFSFTFETAGTFTYHDEQDPLKFHGMVMVR